VNDRQREHTKEIAFMRKKKSKEPKKQKSLYNKNLPRELQQAGYEVAAFDEFGEALAVAVDEVRSEFVFEGGFCFGAVVVFDGEEGVGADFVFEEAECIWVESKVAFFSALFAGG